jgi:eukaryotic-like serine/threonine-protein kinase
MSDRNPVPQLIRHASETTPIGRVSRGHQRPLPDDLLRDASRRLGIMACLGGVLWITGVILKHVAFRALFPERGWTGLGGSDAIGAIGAALSFATYSYTRRSTRSPAFILDLGHGYLILTAILLGMIWHWETVPGGWPVFPQISWIGAVIVIAAAIVPSAPSKMLLTGLIAVSMNPLGMVIAKARGSWNYGSESNLLLMHYPDYLLVGVAVVISAVVTRLGQQVSKARELGSYQVGDLLGQGGMGQVYRATHRMLARPAAIKLIRPETLATEPAARELAIKRFHREAEVAARLRSPHTVALYDFGQTEDQTLYFVMELLEGMNLEALVRDHGPVPANRAIRILVQVCDSLEEAHALGLVHRDIKPANIHIGRLGLRHDYVKVLDFGLVKQVTGPSSEASMATGIGGTPGTPDYMAPEMTLGENVDRRADLYALGCVGYFLLTAKVVFEAANVFHMIARHLNDTPVAPSVRAGIAIPAELEQVVLRCLEKQPDRRPQSAGEIRQALCGIAVEPWGEPQAAAWWNALALSGSASGADSRSTRKSGGPPRR